MVDFIKRTGKSGIITDPAHLGAALEGKAGTRITAGCKSGSHESSPPAFLRHNQFSKDWFIKLNEIAACVSQVDQFFP